MVIEQINGKEILFGAKRRPGPLLAIGIVAGDHALRRHIDPHALERRLVFRIGGRARLKAAFREIIVRINETNGFTLGRADARVSGGADPQIFREMDDLYPGVAFGIPVEDVTAPVRRRVVDADRFDPLQSLRQDAVEAAPKIALHIVNRQHDRHADGFGVGHGVPQVACRAAVDFFVFTPPPAPGWSWPWRRRFRLRSARRNTRRFPGARRRCPGNSRSCAANPSGWHR